LVIFPFTFTFQNVYVTLAESMFIMHGQADYAQGEAFPIQRKR